MKTMKTITLTAEQWAQLNQIIEWGIIDDSDGCNDAILDERNDRDRQLMDVVRAFRAQAGEL